MADPRKWAKPRPPGQCAGCDRETYEITDRFPHGHPYAGLPRRVGAPREDAIRVSFVQCSGATMTVTVCEKCFDDIDHTIVFIWKRLGWHGQFEMVHRADIGAGWAPPDKIAEQLDLVAQTFNDTPIGMIFSERATDHVRRDGPHISQT